MWDKYVLLDWYSARSVIEWQPALLLEYFQHALLTLESFRDCIGVACGLGVHLNRMLHLCRL